MKDDSHRLDIDGLRGIAVLAVVLYHAFPKVFQGGFVGVDIFFVLSGFLITSIILNSLAQGTFTFRNFYSKRVRRIFPALAVILIVTLIFGWFALLPDEFLQLGKHAFGGAAFISNFILSFEDGYFNNLSDTKPLLHLWSLGIEEQFYLLWPFLVFIAWKKKLNGLYYSLLIAGLSFCLNVIKLKSAPTLTFYYPITRFWELLFGSIIAYAYTYQSKLFISSNLKTNTVKSIIGIIFILTGIFTFRHRTPFPGFAALLPTFGSVLLISAGANAWVNKKILTNKILVWFGVISYSLYLWHWPLLSFARIMESETPKLFLRITIFLLSILLAWISTMYFERWFRFGSRNMAKIAIPSLAILLVAIMGQWIEKNNGFQNRFLNLTEYRKQLILPEKNNETCLKLFNNESPLFNYCKFDGELESGKEIVAVIGDSHAFVLYAGIKDLLSEQHKESLLFANSGCPPLKGLLQAETEDGFDTCEKKIDQILKTLTSHPNLSKRIKKVIIATRGVGYITGKGYGAIEPVPWLIKYSNPALKKLSKEAAFGQSLIATSKLLIANGKMVYYVMENPELGFDIKSCINRPLTLTKKAGICSIPLNLVLERQAKYRHVVQAIKIDGLTIIDPIPLHCPNGICQPIVNGELLYADDDHWSYAGSKLVTKELLSICLLRARNYL